MKKIQEIKAKYFALTGEIAFRLWMFANAVEALKTNHNEEKAQKPKTSNQK